MTDTPTGRKLSERFAEFVQAWKDGGDPHEDANTILRMGRFAIDRSDTILRALRLAESRPSAIREAVEGEREACAKIADSEARPTAKPYDPYRAAAEAVAIRIRARGEEKENG